MALQINAGDDVKRGDYFFVDPYQVIVKEELRGRHKPPTEEAIIDMACSILDNGQRQPVECRKLSDKRLQLNLGFTRTAAVRLIRQGFTDPDGVHRHDPDIKLKVIISDANDEQAFINNVVENAHRNQTSPIDDAHNQQRLRDKLGYSDPQITKLYRYKDENKVARLRRLLMLPNAIQDQVHDGVLPVQAALDLLDLPDDKRDEAIKAATDTKTGKVVASQVRAQVREEILRDQEGQEQAGTSSSGTATATAPRYKALTLKEVRGLFEEYKESDNETLKELGKVALLWIAGRKSKKYMDEHFKKLAGAKK